MMDARGGTRYTEIIRSHFGVISPDQRLQRPEYLGGSNERISVNPVAQTSSTDATTPQGNLSAFSTVTERKGGFIKSFTEHCIVIGLVNIRADLTYQQGLERHWSYQTRYDFPWPSLSVIGEQAVLNREIYAQGDDVVDGSDIVDEQVFGYQERYAESRYKPSLITGKFRSTDAQSLDIWHLSQEFEALPVLNDEFIVEDPPFDRINAVTDEPQLLLDCWFEYLHTRPLPKYGVPASLLGRF